MTVDRGEPGDTPLPGSTPDAPQGGGGAADDDSLVDGWYVDLEIDTWLETRRNL